MRRPLCAPRRRIKGVGPSINIRRFTARTLPRCHAPASHELAALPDRISHTWVSTLQHIRQSGLHSVDVLASQVADRAELEVRLIARDAVQTKEAELFHPL